MAGVGAPGGVGGIGGVGIGGMTVTQAAI